IRSVRLLTDATGATIAGSRRDYLPFGEEWPGRTAIQDERFFEGKERDKETTLDDFGGRYYTSNAGRFPTVAPALNIGHSLTHPQRWNRYAYGLNNPLRYGDPD